MSMHSPSNFNIYTIRIRAAESRGYTSCGRTIFQHNRQFGRFSDAVGIKCGTRIVSPCIASIFDIRYWRYVNASGAEGRRNTRRGYFGTNWVFRAGATFNACSRFVMRISRLNLPVSLSRPWIESSLVPPSVSVDIAAKKKTSKFQTGLLINDLEQLKHAHARYVYLKTLIIDYLSICQNRIFLRKFIDSTGQFS